MYQYLSAQIQTNLRELWYGGGGSVEGEEADCCSASPDAFSAG